MSEEKGFRSEEEMEASAAKMRAEAMNAEAEARKNLAQAIHHEHEAEMAEIRLIVSREAEESRKAADYFHRTYRFLGSVTAGSARDAVSQLVEWHRLDGDDPQPITFVIDSPGGGIIEGNHLYDTILWMRSEGHHITTLSQGMAASMGGILLQAGDKRVMAPNASMLIHEASFGAGGSFGQVEDQVEFVRKLQDKLLDILAERSNLSKTQIKNRWKRKNWWLSADEALKFGFIDEIA